MTELDFIVGKVSELPQTKRSIPNRANPLYIKIYEYFGLLRADETIKLPIKGLSKRQAQNKAAALRYALGKKYPDRIVGASVGEDFIFLFSRGLKDKPKDQA